jgi:ribosomal protein S18 acetylase RimI-like enzyme
MSGSGDRCLSRRVFSVPDEIEIRPIRESEYEAAGEATVRAFSEFLTPGSHGWEAYLARIADVGGRAGRAIVLVAVEDGVIAGSVTLELDSRISPGVADPLAPDEAHVRMLGVSPDHRGRGIARRLMLACIDAARAHGKQVMTLDTDPVMTAAQQLYASLGFAPTSPRVRPDGMVLLSYTLDIESAAPANR